jgi:hypothetical protein
MFYINEYLQSVFPPDGEILLCRLVPTLMRNSYANLDAGCPMPDAGFKIQDAGRFIHHNLSRICGIGTVVQIGST